MVVVHLPDDDGAAGVVDRLEEDPEAFLHCHSSRNYPKMLADDRAYHGYPAAHFQGADLGAVAFHQLWYPPFAEGANQTFPFVGEWLLL
jgi:hypothetical protein